MEQFSQGRLRVNFDPRASSRLGDDYLPTAKEFVYAYTVNFHPSLTQPAERIQEKGEYYYLMFDKRTFSIRKSLVASIVKS